MKSFTIQSRPLVYCTLISLCLFAMPLVQAQTYVNHLATGNNDGSSWADAYNELADALDNYSAGDEIWVAAGTYTPHESAAWTDGNRTTFYLYQDVQLYGGFNGTESSLDQRDPSTNLTVLSGDLNGDDVVDDFENNREDNVINVIYVEASVTTASVLDGFTVTGGHADIDDNFFPNKRGGGMFSWGAIQTRHCTFEQNYTIWHAGGIYYFEVDAGGGRVENCIFQNNKCLSLGAGVTVAHLFNEAVTIENCQFINNDAAQGGGGLYFFQSNGVATNCQFTDNVTNLHGGGLHVLMNDVVGGANLTVAVSDCIFQGNSAGLVGGGMSYYNNNSSGHEVSIDNCRFLENTSANGGGFYYFPDGASDGNLVINACDFIENQANETSEDSLAEGGGILIGSSATPALNDTIRIENCLIQNNTADFTSGGVLYIHSEGSDNHFAMNNCQVIGNQVMEPGLSVGGIGIGEGGTNISVRIQNTLFEDNSSLLFQGFAVGAAEGVASPAERNIELVNCLFTRHNSNATGTAVVGTTGAFTLTNCTFVDNENPLISTFGIGKISAQNNILHSNGFPTYTRLDGNPGQSLISLGGNLVSSNDIDDYLKNTDQSGIDPLFAIDTYELSATSPAIDAGVLVENPVDTDYSGNSRIQGSCIDIGALESPYDAGTECLITSVRKGVDYSANLIVFPNPMANLATVSLESEWNGTIEISITNGLGQTVSRQQVEKTSSALEVSIDLQQFPAGVYKVTLSNGVYTVSESLTKH